MARARRPFWRRSRDQGGWPVTLITETATLSAEQLYDLDSFKKNHGSFNEELDGAKPTMEELLALVDQGFARVFENEEAASGWLGTRPVISPYGECSEHKIGQHAQEPPHPIFQGVLR